MSQPTWKNHLESRVYSRLFNGSLRSGKGTGLFWGSQGVGWLAMPFREEWPSTFLSPYLSASFSQPYAGVCRWESCLGGRGGLGRFPGCAHALERNTEKNLARAEPGSLSFLFEFSVLHSQHQPEEEMCILKVTGTFWSRGRGTLYYREWGGLPETQTPVEWKGLCDLHWLWFTSSAWISLTPLPSPKNQSATRR